MPTNRFGKLTSQHLLRSASSVGWVLGIIILLGGCGENGQKATADKREESHSCISCHDNDSNLSPVTGDRVVQEWLRSVHNTKNGAGCADCHEPSPSHPESCSRCHSVSPGSTGHISVNPDQDGKCAKCHHSTVGFPGTTYDGIAVDTARRHFNTHSASYVSSRNVGRCRSCHNPHDTSSRIEQFRAWSRSGKGSISAPAWTAYDFKTRGTTTPGATTATSFGDDCVRCHTTTGFIDFVASDSIAPWESSADPTKEVLGCRACHDDGRGNAFSYRPRAIGPITAYYNYSVTTRRDGAIERIRLHIPYTFPNVGTSNICIACHTGRESGAVIRSASGQLNFSTAGFINSHYLTAGATVFAVSGFHFYSAGSTYVNPASYLHSQIGIKNQNGTGSDGPCVTCHIGQDGERKRHSFLPLDRSGTLVSQTCARCHTSSSTMSSSRLEQAREGWEAALTVLAKILKDRGYQYTDSYPYFAAKNWQTLRNGGTAGGFGSAEVPGTGGMPAGALTLGAAFNFNLIRHDRGAYAHNSLYTRRLMYDSIDWMLDGKLGNGVDEILSLADDPAVFMMLSPDTGRTVAMPLNQLIRSRALSYLRSTNGIRP